MISVLPLRDKNELTRLYSERGIEYTDNSIAVVAKQKDEVLGCCLFTLDEDSVTVLSIEPVSDIMLADGILRSALHVGVENGKNKAYWKGGGMTELFKKLHFVENEDEHSLKVSKLFESCCGCGANT